MSDLAPRFFELFAGFDRAHGECVYGTEFSELGKRQKISAATRTTGPSVELWRSHLAGETGLGVVPVRSDDSCVFGAVDVDGDDHDYRDFDPALVAARVAEIYLPLIVCRSSSNGAHAYLFAAEPVSAAAMRARLEEIRRLIGAAPKTEIFPVQTKLIFGDNGSWINMPFFGAERWAVGSDSLPIDPEQFLALAETRKQPISFFERPIAAAFEAETKWFPDGPPCLQKMVANGAKIQEGGRNIAYLNAVHFLRRAFPSDWKPRAKEYAFQIFEPAVDWDEANRTAKSSGRKNYRYSCKVEPMRSFCDAAVCRTRRFGVGRDGRGGDEGTRDDGESSQESLPMPAIGELRKLCTDPPTWYVDVGGRTVEMTTEELQSPRLFQRRSMDRADLVMPSPTQTSWERMLSAMMQRVVLMEAPRDGSAIGQFWNLVNGFSGTRAAPDREAVLNGRPYSEGGRTWFSLDHLQVYFDRNHFKDFARHKITALLREGGAEHAAWKIRGKTVNVWGVADPPRLEPKGTKSEEEAVF